MKLLRKLPQGVRHLMRLAVIGFIVYAAAGTVWRNYKTAHNNARLIGLMHGPRWAELYAANEDLLELISDDTVSASRRFLGFPWAGRIGGLDTVDPLLAASQLITVGHVSTSLLLGLVLPLALALLLGKVFCSHLCPMRLVFEIGELVRAGLMRLGLPLPELRTEVRVGGWVLVGGLIATSLSSAVVWLFILPYASLSVSIFVAVTTGTASLIFWIVGCWWAVDALLAPGFFCHNVCPTGFLLEQVGRFSLIRLHKRGGDHPCPEKCDVCVRACPYALRPVDRTHRPACDNCGRCASVCPQKRLVRRLPVIVGIGLAAALLAPSAASAHHNKGLPHYGYYQNYPQVPTEEYVAIDGRWEIGATIFNFQGYDGRRSSDTPNDVKIYLYLYDVDADRSYTGPVDIEVRLDGRVVARFDRAEADEESVYSTRETLPETGEYELVAVVDGEVVTLPFYVDLNDGMPWWLIALLPVPALVVFGLALFGRKRRLHKKRNRRAPVPKTAGGTKALLALAALPLVSPALVRAQATATDAVDAASEGCATGDGARQVLTDSGPIQVMTGLPVWVFLLGIVGVLGLSFAATEWFAPRRSRPSSWRFNLIKSKGAQRFMRSRALPSIPQLVMIALLAGLIYAGLAGSRVANITPTLVWTIWWAGLVFSVLFLGSTWCLVCPWDGLANLASRLRAFSRVEPISLGLRFPRWAMNLWPAIILFIALTWLELGWGVTTDPRATAIMGLGMAALAVTAALLFDGKRFCAHACPVGRICGIYSNFAPVEIRARNKNVCAKCVTEDCLNGNERGYACPTGISLKVVQEATDCTMCTECIKSCDKMNVALNIRPFGADLGPDRQPRSDEAWLAVTLLSLTLFHGLSMTSTWESFEPGRWSVLKWMGLTFGASRTVNFTVAMAIACAAPVLFYWWSCRWAARWAGGGVTAPELFRRFAIALLPIALFYHLAHNLMHLLMEGGHVVPLLSDPLGAGADLFGTARTRVGELIREPALWTMQVALILIGHVVGIVVAHRIGHKIYRDKRRATRSLLPMFAVMVAVSIVGLGLMHLDMNMRLGRM